MKNAIIIAILIIVLIIGVKETVKHFRGEGSCCGGGSKPLKKKLKGKILHTYTIKVTDMHCKNCVYAVTRAVNDIEGAAAVVSLRKKTAKVSCDRDIDEEIIKDKIRSRGYTVG